MFLSNRKVKGKVYFSFEERYREDGKVKSKSFSIGRYDKAMKYVASMYYKKLIDKEKLDEYSQYINKNNGYMNLGSFNKYVLETSDEDMNKQYERYFNPTFTESKNLSERIFGKVKTKEELKKRYRKLAKLLHPDTGGDEELFKLVDEEYRKFIEEL